LDHAGGIRTYVAEGATIITNAMNKHLDYYLDEFTFRFNRRNSRSRGKLFLRLAEQAVAVGPAPYKSMVRCFATTDGTNHNI
jgi:hypothetical protein